MDIVSATIKENREDKYRYPSPGTSLSFSPRAWSWLEKLTNSAPSSLSCGRFLRSLAMARRAARSSLLRSSSPFLLLRTVFCICFLDILATALSLDQKQPVCLKLVSLHLHQSLRHLWKLLKQKQGPEGRDVKIVALTVFYIPQNIVRGPEIKQSKYDTSSDLDWSTFLKNCCKCNPGSIFYKYYYSRDVYLQIHQILSLLDTT